MASRDIDDICFRCRNHLLDPWEAGKPVDKQWKVLFDCQWQQYHCIGHRQCQTNHGLGRRNAKCSVCQSSKLPKPIIVTSLDNIIYQGSSKGSNDDIEYPVFRVRTPEPDVDDSIFDDGIGRGRSRSRGRGRGSGRGRGRGRSTSIDNSRNAMLRTGPRITGESEDALSFEDDSLLSSGVLSTGRVTQAVAADEQDTESEGQDDGNLDTSRSTSATPGVSPSRGSPVSFYRSRGAGHYRSRSLSPSRSSPGESPARSTVGLAAVREELAAMLGGRPVLPPVAAPAAAPVAARPAVGAFIPPVAAPAAAPVVGSVLPPVAAPAAAPVAAGPAVEPQPPGRLIVGWPEDDEDREPAADVVDLTEVSPIRVPPIYVNVNNYAGNLEPYLNQLISLAANNPTSLGTVITNLFSIPIDEHMCNSMVHFFRNVIMPQYQGRIDRWMNPLSVKRDTFELIEIDDSRYIDMFIERINPTFDKMLRGVTVELTGTEFRNTMKKAIYTVAQARSFQVALECIQEGSYNSTVVFISKMLVKVYDRALNTLRDDLRNQFHSIGHFDTLYTDGDLVCVTFRGVELCSYFVTYASKCAFKVLEQFLSVTDVSPVTNVGKLSEAVSEKNYEAYLYICDLLLERASKNFEQIGYSNQYSGRANVEFSDSELRTILGYLATMRHYLREYETRGERHDWPIWKHIVPALTNQRDDETINQILQLRCSICLNVFVNGPSSTTDQDNIEHNLMNVELRFACTHMFHSSCLNRNQQLCCSLCRNPYSRRNSAGSICDIVFSTSDIINNTQISDQGRLALSRVMRLARYQVLPQSEITPEQRELNERERRATEALRRAREAPARAPDNSQARRRLAERILIDSDKNKSQVEDSTTEKRRRLVSPLSAAASEALVEATTAVSETIVAETTTAPAEVTIAAAEATTAAAKVTTAAAETITATAEVTTAAVETTTATVEITTAAGEITTVAAEPIKTVSEPTITAPAVIAAHPGPAPETGRLTALLSGASDVATAAPRLRLLRPGKAKPKLAMDTTEVCFVRTLRKYLRMLIKTRQGESIRIPYEGFDFYFSDEQIQDMIQEHLGLIQTIEATTFDVTDVSAFVERVLADDGATCAELLAIYDRVDAEGAGA